MFKEIVKMIVEAETWEELAEIAEKIDRAFDEDKITFKEHEILYMLEAKIIGDYKPYKGMEV